MASPPPPPHADGDGAAVCCCMCGDHGLRRELFRCESCRVRLQHSYCSDLYPRANAYVRCNWCLVREPQSAGGEGAAAAYHGSRINKPAAEELTKRKTAATASDEERRQRQRHEGGCSSSSRRSSPAELGSCPVKKRRKADEARAPAPVDAGVVKVKGRCHDSAGESKKEKLVRAGKPAARVRVKVRRYKLLAEVISCG